jgi:predicted TIM-barrel fold metal-dependent hydrolase
MPDKKVVDIHVHLGGTGDSGSGCRMSLQFIMGPAFLVMLIVMKASPADVNDARIREIIVGAVNRATKVDRAVLLALDGVYKAGKYIEPESHLVTPNQWVIDTARDNPKVLFGASVHPYRKKKDLLGETRRCIDQGAALFKWIPSSQQIDPGDDRCLPFYEMIAEAKVPLLCHTGAELAVPTSDGDAVRLNDPRRLRKALSMKVKVIAAHCATPYLGGLLPDDTDYFDELTDMLKLSEKKGWKLYADISAFCTPTRIKYLNRIQKEIDKGRIDAGRFLFGSDFPIPIIDINVFKDPLGARELLAHLKGEENPLDRNYDILKTFGIDESIFTNAWEVLRIPNPLSAPC